MRQFSLNVCVWCFTVWECVRVSGAAPSGCTRTHGFLTSLCVCLSEELAAAYFLLSSTVNSSGSLSSLQLHFTQSQTLLAVFRGKVESETQIKRDLWSEAKRRTGRHSHLRNRKNKEQSLIPSLSNIYSLRFSLGNIFWCVVLVVVVVEGRGWEGRGATCVQISVFLVAHLYEY